LFRKKVEGCIEVKSSEIEMRLKEQAKTFDVKKIKGLCAEEVTDEPRIYFGMMLSGSSVIDSVSQVGIIRRRFPSAIGLEMEAHAVYCAVESGMGAKPSALVIKGVADHGQGKKNHAAQKMASSMSYFVAMEILANVLPKGGR
jgi:nucleoside phosphorylase